MSSIVKFVEKSRYHLETFFPGWTTTKHTIMIPPAPITNFPGPIQKGASGYSEELVAKKGPIIDGDSAEAAVHSFLFESNQHAFVLQNYTTSKWKRILKSRGYDASDNFSAEMMKIEDLEIDFLVLHAYVGIIAFECKAVKSFQLNRYSDSKKQLDRLGLMIEKLTRLLQPESGELLDHVIPLKKVISFPFVEMKQDVRNPFNLGKTDIDADAKLWWNRLLNERECEINLFSKNRLYQNLVITMVGMYNAVELSIGENVMDVYRAIDEQRFYDGCSSSDVYRRNNEERSYFDRLFFLNPEQQSVLQCSAKKQLLHGEVGTGKTILLMQKALIALRKGEKIAFIVPECLEPKYNSFKRKYNDFGECTVLAFKNSLLLFEKEEKQAGADIISTLQDPNVSLFLDEWQKFVIPAKDNLSLINYNNQPSLREENQQNDFIKTCQEILIGRTANTCVVLSAGTRFGSVERFYMLLPIYRAIIDQFLEKDFQLLFLTSILRGTCHIVGQWFNLSQLSGLSWSNYSVGKKLPEVMGHNIKGCPVEKTFSPRDGFGTLVKQILQKLKHWSENIPEKRCKFWPHSVGVLCDDEALVSELTPFLLESGIPVGSIAEQMDNGKVVAFDNIANSISYEWSVVVAINSKLDHYQDSLKLAMSRAISKLYLLENDKDKRFCEEMRAKMGLA